MKGISRRFISIIWVASLMVAMCLLYSCAKMTVIESEQIGVGTLSLSVTVAGDTTSFENKLANNAPLRTIAPPQLTETQLNAGYTLKLTASNEIQGDIVQNITLTDGKATLSNIPFGSWEFKLEALDGNNTPVLEAVSGATIDYVKLVHVSFVLKPVKNGTGNVNVTFNLNNTDFTQLGAGSTVKVGLYNPVDYKVINEQNPAFAQNFTYNPQNIPAGEYILRLTITAGANGSLKQGAYVTWSDRIYVETTRTSGATVTLTQLFKKPDSPATPNLTNNGVTAGVANVTLTWGHVYTADSYELEVLEYTGNRPTNDTMWTTAQNAGSVVTYNATPNDQNNYLAHNNKFASQYYIGGGLLACQNDIRLGLKVSTKSYAARIRATNFYGNSDWVYFPDPAIPTIASPTAPANFSFTTGYYEATSGSFSANFTWDNADNEDGYEMQLMRISKDSVTPRTDNTWNALARTDNVTTYKGNNVGSSGGNPSAYEGGGLLADSTGLRLSIKRLPSEYYVVRLRSYNAGGVSGWVYPIASASGGSLLLPPPLFTVTTTGTYTNPNNRLQVYDATLTVQDISGNTFTYVYEWIALRSNDLTSLFTATNQAAKDAAWKTLRDIPQNNTDPYLSGDNREISSLQIRVPMLNANTPFPFRVRTVVKSGGQVVEATPWYYHLKKIINQ